MRSSSVIPGATLQPEPAWAIAELFPAQGEWTEEDYLALDGTSYVTRGRYGSGQRAAAALLAGLEVGFDRVFAAGNN